MPARPAERILILGWDAADWTFINRRLSEGGMPCLRGLLARSSHSPLLSLEPKLSPLLWTSVVTGVTADRHGILNFVEPDDTGGGLRVVSCTSRRRLALWNILTRAGLSSRSVAWYASHPAEPVRGAVVSNLFLEGFEDKCQASQGLPAGAVSLPEWGERIAACRLRGQDVPDAILDLVVPSWKGDPAHPRLTILRRHLARCLSVHRVALALLREPGSNDCTFVFQDAIDAIGHHFMQFHPPCMSHVTPEDFARFSRVMDGVYELHDTLLGELLAAAGPNMTVLLLSDHGFHSGDERPLTEGLDEDALAAAEARWHRDHGILVMAGPGVRPNAPLHEPCLLDITPTVLALLGLPKGEDMDGRVLAEAIDRPAPATIPSWETVEGNAGLHPPELRLDPFESREAMQQLIDLGYLAALPETQRERQELVARETRFNLGLVHLARGQTSAAARIFAELTAAVPAESRYALNHALALLRCGQAVESADVLRGLLEKDPQEMDTRQLLATALATAGMTKEAAAALENAGGAAWSEGPRATRLGDLYVLLGDREKAMAHYREALSRSPDDPAGLLGLGKVALSEGDYEMAVERFLDVLDIHPRLPEGHHQLGVALAWLGMMEAAIESLETAVRLHPGNLPSLLFLAALHLQQGDSTAAAASEAAIEALLDLQSASPSLRAFARRDTPRGPASWVRHITGAQP
jgi:predicted AlkP superfamily phosphohydrolase/phosphomutase/tetratricopeptide (TPR) repeat protein